MIRFDIYKGDRFGTDIVMFTLVFKKIYNDKESLY